MKADALPLNYQNLIREANEVRIYRGLNLKGFPGLGQAGNSPDEARSVVLHQMETETMIEALNRGIIEATDHARCFIPRHFVQAKRGNKVLRLSICFECLWIWAQHSDEDNELHLDSTSYAESFFDHHLNQKFPAIGVEDEMENAVRSIRGSISTYTLPIPRMLARDYAKIEECEAKIRSYPALKTGPRLLRLLAQLRQELQAREQKEMPK